ncbi:unnamed protein product [Boreogadus saida]
MCNVTANQRSTVKLSAVQSGVNCSLEEKVRGACEYVRHSSCARVIIHRAAGGPGTPSQRHPPVTLITEGQAEWWNELPAALRTAESLTIFRKRLKTHLFRVHLDSA